MEEEISIVPVHPCPDLSRRIVRGYNRIFTDGRGRKMDFDRFASACSVHEATQRPLVSDLAAG